MLVSDVIARLKQRSQVFSGRVEGAAELSGLARRKALPQAPWCA